MNFKPALFAALILSIATSVFSQVNPKYDKTLADSLGADEYGMKMYVLVLLKTGTAKINDKKITDSLFAGHMKNIQRLADEGKLSVAGPLQKNDKNYRGIFILNVKTIDEANTLLQTDPTIKAQVLDAELYGWYGSAALPMYLPASEKVNKLNF
jgi:uncharacterized protein YciI